MLGDIYNPISQKIELYEMLLKYATRERKSKIENILRALQVVQSNSQATITLI